MSNGTDSLQVPPPSLWPVGFALGVVCLLVGVIVSWVVAAVGAGVALVFGFLWVREVMSASRARTEPAASAAGEGDRIEAPPLPAQEAGSAMPEPTPEEIARFPRSKFLEGATLGIGAVIGGAVTVPAVGLMVVPAFTKQGRKPVDVGALGDYPEGQWVVSTFYLKPGEGEIWRRTAYIRNNGVADGKPSFTIISNRCAHLGCPVQPNALLQQDKAKDETSKQGADIHLVPALGLSGFGCPCHGGAYDTEGNRTAGPPVRGLDRYDFSVIDGRLYLDQTYSVNHVDGAGAAAKIQRFELAGPGQHVSGIEGWLYPLQPPHG